MICSKPVGIPKQAERISELFRTVAHPARIGILQMLDEGDKNLHELYEQFGCSQSVMLQHIRILRDWSLIECKKEGTSKYCTIQAGNLSQLIECAHTCIEQLT
jgi:DNA-binding transcriptional ArsR family regulator